MQTRFPDIVGWQMRVALERDETAYRELFYHFYASHTRFAFSFLKSKESAEEVYCDVFMKLWQLGESLNKIENLKLYLYKSVKNASLNYLAKYHKADVVDIDSVNADDVLPAQPENVLQNEFQRNFQKAVRALSPQARLAYQLIKEEGLSYKEVAQLLGISVHSVETHMQRALAALRNSVRLYLRPDKN